MGELADISGEELPITVVIVNADPVERARLVALAKGAGHKVVEAASAGELLGELAAAPRMVVVVDRNAGDMTATQTMQALRLRDLEVPTVVTVPPMAILDAVDAIRAGARDVLEYPLGEQRFLRSIVAAARRHDP